MMESPGAALVAEEIARVAEFFSFGTNDLTQMTFGFSRDDIEGRFLPRYLELHLLPANPFETLAVDGVGLLVRMPVDPDPPTPPHLNPATPSHHAPHPPPV